MRIQVVVLSSLQADDGRDAFLFFLSFSLKAFIFQLRRKCSDTRVQQSANVFSVPLVQSLAVWFLLSMNFSGVLGSDSQAILSVLFSLA